MKRFGHTSRRARLLGTTASAVLLAVMSTSAWSAPRLSVEKAIVGGSDVTFGANVTFRITVSNTGDVPLKNVLVTDGAAPDCGGYLASKGGPADLQPGDSFSYECVALNVQSEFSNRARVVGEFQNGNQCRAGTTGRSSNRVTLSLRDRPAIDIRKQEEGADSRTILTGSDVDFEIEVKNTGDLPLTGVVVTDPLVVDCEAMIGDLAPGDSRIYVCTKTNVTSEFNNNARATGRAILTGGDPAGCEVTDLDRSRVRLEALECAVAVSKEADPEVIVLTPPPSCETISGRPDSLTFKYTAGGCAASSNDQGDKSSCEGAVNPAEAASIVAGKKDLSNLYVVQGSPVLPGDSFTVLGPFESDSGVELSNTGGVEFNRIHTSCSQPLQPGDVFGSLTLVAINGEFGSSSATYTYQVSNLGNAAEVTIEDDKLGPIPEAGQNVIAMASGQVEIFQITTEILETTTNVVTVSAKLANNPAITCMSQAQATVTVQEPPKTCDDGKPTALVFEYTGQSCAASNNTQGGKTDCTGDPGAASPVEVVITKDADKISVTPAGESLAVGGLVTIARSDGNRFASETTFDVRQGGATLQSLTVHTSCSAPLNVGDQFGSMILREFIPEAP